MTLETIAGKKGADRRRVTVGTVRAKGVWGHCLRCAPHSRPTSKNRRSSRARRRRVQASLEWLDESAAEFRPDEGRYGYAQLRHYTAAYCEMGAGPPLVLVPGLAGGFELLSPLARLLARHFRV